MSRGSRNSRAFAKKGERGFIASRAAAEALNKALFSAVAAWQCGSDVSVDDLTRLLLNGTPEEVAAAIMPPDADALLRGEYAEVAAEAIKIAGDGQWADLDLVGSFSLDNPYSPPWIRSYSSTLIQEIGDLSRWAIREEVARSFERGIPPRLIANTLGDWAGLRRDQSAALDAYAQSLREGGVTGDRYEALIGRRAQSLRNDRGLLIARTEVINAHGHGTLQSWQTAQGDGLLGDDARKVWIAAVGSERTCEVCIALDGQSVALDEPFRPMKVSAKRGPVLAPTVHPRCRCAIGLELA